MTLLITEKDVEGILSIEAAIPVIEQAFRIAGEGSAENPPRFRMPFKKGFLQFGPAALHSKQLVGFKLWANFGSPLRQVWNFLFSMETSELLAIIQAHLISKYRTSAVTAVGVKYLSPPDAVTVGLYGTGRQADGQLEAICAVRPIRKVNVYSPNRENRENFCSKMSQKLGIDIIPASAPEQVLAEADIVVTMTKAENPVLLGRYLTRRGLIIAAGANHWYKREVDEAVVEAADLIVVDEKEQAKVECGDLLWPIGHGLFTWDRVESLGHIVTGRVPVPTFKDSLILLETQGAALTDVAISAMAYDLARKHGVGQEIAL